LADANARSLYLPTVFDIRGFSDRLWGNYGVHLPVGHVLLDVLITDKRVYLSGG
jgi:hypothetical protein